MRKVIMHKQKYISKEAQNTSETNGTNANVPSSLSQITCTNQVIYGYQLAAAAADQ